MEYTKDDILNVCKFYKGGTQTPYDRMDPAGEDLALLWFWKSMWCAHYDKGEQDRRFYDEMGEQTERIRRRKTPR